MSEEKEAEPSDFEQDWWKKLKQGCVLIEVEQHRHPYLARMLITSISGIRGTVGGRAGEGVKPPPMWFNSQVVRVLGSSNKNQPMTIDVS